MYQALLAWEPATQDCPVALLSDLTKNGMIEKDYIINLSDGLYKIFKSKINLKEQIILFRKALECCS